MAGLEPPSLLVDRSLGTLAVPAFFRSNWSSTVKTTDEIFGEGKVEDVVWMQWCQDQGWAAVCKDDRIRRRVGERQLMSQGTLQVFCLPNGNMKRDLMVDRFATHLQAMLTQVEQPGPWMMGVYAHGLAPLTLYG